MDECGLFRSFSLMSLLPSFPPFNVFRQVEIKERRAIGLKTLFQDHLREENFIKDEVEHCADLHDIFMEDSSFPERLGMERLIQVWDNMVRLRSALLKLKHSKRILFMKKQAWLAVWNASPSKMCLLEWESMEKELLVRVEQKCKRLR